MSAPKTAGASVMLRQEQIGRGATPDGIWLDDHRRVMLRTDGRFIVYDDRRPLGQRTLSVHATAADAVAVARGKL